MCRSTTGHWTQVVSHPINFGASPGALPSKRDGPIVPVGQEVPELLADDDGGVVHQALQPLLQEGPPRLQPLLVLLAERQAQPLVRTLDGLHRGLQSRGRALLETELEVEELLEAPLDDARLDDVLVGVLLLLL